MSSENLCTAGRFSSKKCMCVVCQPHKDAERMRSHFVLYVFPFLPNSNETTRNKNTEMDRIGLVWFGLFWYGLTLCCCAKEMDVLIEPGNFLSMTYYLEYLESLFIPIMFWFKIKRITIWLHSNVCFLFVLFFFLSSFLKWMMTVMMMPSFYIT